MWQRLTQPWTLHVSESEDAQIALVWRNRFPLALLALLVAIQLILPSRVWTALMLVFGMLLAVSAGWAWVMARSVHVRRDWGAPWLQAGDTLRERFTITNRSALPALWVEVRDGSQIPGYTASVVRSIGVRESRWWIATGECRLRGEYRLGPWEATTGDPLGLFNVVQRNPKVQSMLVYPPIARRLPFGLPRGAGGGAARASRRSWDATVNVGGIRAYVPGDPRRHIHWPTTARRNQFFVKEFDQETGGDVWLVLDMDRDAQVGQGERSTAEMSVIVAASVAAMLLDTGRAVGLVTYGPERHIVMPGRGRGHLWNLLRALAQVQPAESRPLARVLENVGRALSSGATALVITASLNPAWIAEAVRLHGRGVGAAVLLMDAPSFTAPPPPPDAHAVHFSPQSLRMRELLAEAQIEAEIIHADMPLMLRPPTGQVRRWEFKTLSTGRAVAVSTPWGVQG